MRIGREDWIKLRPADVAWVAEWQLTTAFPWLPLGKGITVSADDGLDSAGRFWNVTVRSGQETVQVRLPLRDLTRLICWCYRIRHCAALLHPPATIRASLLGLRKALRGPVARLNPLAGMGYQGTTPEQRSLD
jgi:hypothetical protein